MEIRSDMYAKNRKSQIVGRWIIVVGVAAAAGCHRNPLSKSRSESEDSSTAVAVQTASPERRHLSQKFDQPGVIEAFATTDLYPRAAGYVGKLHVDIGDRVKAGQILLEVDVP